MDVGVLKEAHRTMKSCSTCYCNVVAIGADELAQPECSVNWEECRSGAIFFVMTASGVHTHSSCWKGKNVELNSNRDKQVLSNKAFVCYDPGLGSNLDNRPHCSTT